MRREAFPQLQAGLRRQQERGLLGPGSIDEVRAHSRGFARMASAEPADVIDLGSGGGIPGLVLAVESWPCAGVVLLDANQRRCTYLELEVAALGLTERVTVRWGRAEDVGREADQRGRAGAVVARSFGPPAVVAECAAPLLSVGGILVVSDPPGRSARWDSTGLAPLGLEVDASSEVDGAAFTRLRQVRVCPATFPRRPGRPARHPLF